MLGDRAVAARGQSECILSLSADSDTHVQEVVARAQAAGADVVTAPARQPWVYAGTFADPDGHVWMVTSAPLPN